MVRLQTKLSALRIVSWIHGLWGASILALPLIGSEMPRPFGSLEAYLSFMSAEVMATGMLVSAVICRLALKYARYWPRLVLSAVVPQQLILLWGVCWTLRIISISLIDEGYFDVRAWLGCCYLIALSWFHAVAVADLWAFAWGRPRDAE